MLDAAFRANGIKRTELKGRNLDRWHTFGGNCFVTFKIAFIIQFDGITFDK